MNFSRRLKNQEASSKSFTNKNICASLFRATTFSITTTRQTTSHKKRKMSTIFTVPFIFKASAKGKSLQLCKTVQCPQMNIALVHIIACRAHSLFANHEQQVRWFQFTRQHMLSPLLNILSMMTTNEQGFNNIRLFNFPSFCLFSSFILQCHFRLVILLEHVAKLHSHEKSHKKLK